MIFDVLILGGGVAGMSAALIFGSAEHKPFMTNKTVGIILHQKASSLQNALFNNVLGLPEGKLGRDILIEGKTQLSKLYPHIQQIEKEMILNVEKMEDHISITTNKNSYKALNVIVCTGAKRMEMEGLKSYSTLHHKLPKAKNRIMLKNNDYKVVNRIYVAGTLSGARSQFAIAAGSGAAVATDILTEWNDGQTTMIHDKI